MTDAESEGRSACPFTLGDRCTDVSRPEDSNVSPGQRLDKPYPSVGYHPDMYGPEIDVQGEGSSMDQLLRYLGLGRAADCRGHTDRPGQAPSCTICRTNQPRAPT